jgi:hypothetical protein
MVRVMPVWKTQLIAPASTLCGVEVELVISTSLAADGLAVVAASAAAGEQCADREHGSDEGDLGHDLSRRAQPSSYSLRHH